MLAIGAGGLDVAVAMGGGEYFTMQGTGLDMENEALWFFPLAAESQYGWRLPVFFYEALAALTEDGTIPAIIAKYIPAEEAAE